jgi:16S rRNA U1498 N3-methylase RsmE
MRKHEQMLLEVGDAISQCGRAVLPHVAGIGPVKQVAENSSEVKLTSDEGKSYTLSIIEDEDG